jgi:hypothetical protein
MSWHPEPLGEDVRRELARFGGGGSIGDIVAAWPGAVGEGIAAKAWPSRVGRDGTLRVATASSAWAFELTQLSGMIERRLRDILGPAAPTGLRFAPGNLPEGGAEDVKRAQPSVPRVRPEQLAEGERLAAAIEDPALRGVVARAAAASLAAASDEDDGRGV